jgi:hypothetical protein
VTTFSQAVDTVIEETSRPDMKSMIVQYLNQTIRELHTDTLTKLPVGFTSNLVEDEVEVDVESDEAFLWTIPSTHNFQMMESAYYDYVGEYAKQKNPSTAFLFTADANSEYYWYRTGPSQIAFSGHGGSAYTVKLAWFEHCRRLIYYPVATRPATWSDESQTYTYHADYDGTDEERLDALDLTTNWILERYEDLILNGVRAKIWIRIGEESRGKMAYSQFESNRPTMVATETFIRDVRQAK